jgi:hypothetical protein
MNSSTTNTSQPPDHIRAIAIAIGILIAVIGELFALTLFLAPVSTGIPWRTIIVALAAPPVIGVIVSIAVMRAARSSHPNIAISVLALAAVGLFLFFAFL